ncbi:MAG: CopG family transcriptional regulator [Campylobacterales bacterium]|nr:CopG family transcriptional regulator [Campylobacterales bacterium]
MQKEITFTIPTELHKRLEELQEEMGMETTEIFKEALKYYIDLMDIDEAFESDPFSEDFKEDENKDPYDLDSYDLPPLIEDDEGDFCDYPANYE